MRSRHEARRRAVAAGAMGALAGLLAFHSPSKAQQAPPAPEIVVYASEVPKAGLSEFSFAKDPASPGGTMVVTPNEGADLDPPPENDPHVTFQVTVRAGVSYRCWVHMKVGKPKGKTKANLFYVQFSNAVDR